MTSGRTSLATRRVVVASAATRPGTSSAALRIARGRHEPAAVREPLEPIGGVARPHDLDVAESLTQWQRRVVGSDDGDAHAVVGLRTREVEEERGDGVVGMARERRGHVEDPVRHRPVPYGPVMSRADGASDGAVAGDTVGAVAGSTVGVVDSPVFGAFVPRWFELAVLCCRGVRRRVTGSRRSSSR